jgi:hypothetical protein
LAAALHHQGLLLRSTNEGKVDMFHHWGHYVSILVAAALTAGCVDSGAGSTAESRNVLGRGTIDGFSLQRTSGDWSVNATATGPTDFVMSEIQLALSQCVPWHYHNGPVFVIIKSGTGTNYTPRPEGCMRTVNPAGTALAGDGVDVHSLCNEGPENLVDIFVTYIVPHGEITNELVPNPGTCPGGAL